jgi:hypothetical protein
LAARSLVDRRSWAGVAKAGGLAGRLCASWEWWAYGGTVGGLVGLGDGLERLGAELVRGVKAAAGELGGDRQRRPGVRAPALLELEVVAAVGACRSAGRLG